MLKNHPKGLTTLFFTEMWERFGYYLMLGIFFLYMTDTSAGGMSFGRAKASDIMGTYLALVYLTPFLGGLLADRFLGYRNSIVLGGSLMAAGYIGLAIPGENAFWISLFVIIMGNGFFKPNISTLVGNLYGEEKYKKFKDSGYNIFYMGINIGAFVCNFVAAYLRNYYGWGYAFAAAGIGMIFGIIWFLAGQKNVKEADVLKPTNPEDMSLKKIFATVFGPLLLFGAIGWFIPNNIFGSDSNDAFIFASIPVTLFYLSLWVRGSKEDKAPIAALLSIFGVVVIFWAIFHQNSTALTIWAESYTDRSMPAVAEPFANTFGMVQVVDTSPREVQKLDSHGVPLVNDKGDAITEIGPHPYFNNLDESQWKDSEEPVTIRLISTEIFQSVNPGFVVILTPLIVGFFAFLRRRKKEPSTPAKIGWGMFITAISTLIMVAAVFASQNGLEKSSPSWLIGSYLVITIGELFLSPMGLSLVSKLSPPRLTSLMMGGWFLATSIGNKLSGVIAGLWDTIALKEYFFLINFAGAMVGAIAIWLMVKWLRRIVLEHTGSH